MVCPSYHRSPLDFDCSTCGERACKIPGTITPRLLPTGQHSTSHTDPPRLGTASSTQCAGRWVRSAAHSPHVHLKLEFIWCDRPKRSKKDNSLCRSLPPGRVQRSSMALLYLVTAFRRAEGQYAIQPLRDGRVTPHWLSCPARSRWNCRDIVSLKQNIQVSCRTFVDAY